MKEILILDDHFITLKGISFFCKNAFGNNVNIIECSNINNWFETLKSNKNINFCIIDIFVDGKSTFEYISLVKNLYPEISILVMSVGKEDYFGLKSLREGANGYICKTASEEEIIKAIQLVEKGDFYFSKAVFQQSLNMFSGKDLTLNNPFLKLSNQELNVLLKMLNSLSTNEIAIQLNLKPTTVSTFKSRIFEKIGTSKISEILKLAEEFGILNV